MSKSIDSGITFEKGGTRSLESPTPAWGQNGSESAGEKREKRHECLGVAFRAKNSGLARFIISLQNNSFVEPDEIKEIKEEGDEKIKYQYTYKLPRGRYLDIVWDFWEGDETIIVKLMEVNYASVGYSRVARFKPSEDETLVAKDLKDLINEILRRVPKEDGDKPDLSPGEAPVPYNVNSIFLGGRMK